MTARDQQSGPRSIQDDGYQETIDRFGQALDRLARAYEADPEKRQDLIQEIHFAIWRSFEGYDQRCSLRTWVYRVAHNTATSHVTRAFRLRRWQFVTLDQLEAEPAGCEPSAEETLDRRRVVNRLYALIRRLDPVDRQIVVSYRRQGSRRQGRGEASSKPITDDHGKSTDQAKHGSRGVIRIFVQKGLPGRARRDPRAKVMPYPC